MRIVCKGLLCLGPGILALLGALVLAGSAHASGPGRAVATAASPVVKAITASAGAAAAFGAHAVTDGDQRPTEDRDAKPDRPGEAGPAVAIPETPID